MEYVGREEHTEFARRIQEEEHRQNRRIELLEESVKQNTALTLSVEKLANNMENMANEQMRQGNALSLRGKRRRYVENGCQICADNNPWTRHRSCGNANWT